MHSLVWGMPPSMCIPLVPQVCVWCLPRYLLGTTGICMPRYGNNKIYSKTTKMSEQIYTTKTNKQIESQPTLTLVCISRSSQKINFLASPPVTKYPSKQKTFHFYSSPTLKVAWRCICVCPRKGSVWIRILRFCGLEINRIGSVVVSDNSDIIPFQVFDPRSTQSLKGNIPRR